MTQPTHDEMLAFLDNWQGYWADWLENAIGQEDVVEISKAKIVLAQNSANRAGLERHKPKQLGPIKYPNGTLYCSECFTDQGYDGAFPVAFPCPTYTDIYNEIRSAM